MARSEFARAMAFKPEFWLPFEAHGMVRLDTPGGRSLDLVADGNNLRLELHGWQEAREFIPRSFRGRRQTLRSLASMFAAFGLTLQIESAGEAVLRLGHNASPSWLARLLGLAPAHVPVSAIGLLFRRTPHR